MSARQFRWIFVGLVLVFCVLVASPWNESLVFGASITSIDDRYRFEGGTQPWALVFAGAVVGAFALLMRSTWTESAQPVPGLIRRLAAFFLDFTIAMFALAPILGVLPLVVEWRRTGVFAWTFLRAVQSPTDVPVFLASFALVLPGLLAYFALPLVIGKPSPGSCIAGYRIVADAGERVPTRRALLRSVVGYFAVCAWFLAPVVGRDKEAGKFWLDKVFQTHAVGLE